MKRKRKSTESATDTVTPISSSTTSSSSPNATVPPSFPLPPSHSASDHCHVILSQLQQVILSASPTRIGLQSPSASGDDDDDDDDASNSLPLLEESTLVQPDSSERDVDDSLPWAMQGYLKCTQNMEKLLKQCMQILDNAMKSGDDKGDGCARACQWMEDRYDRSKTDASIASSTAASSSSFLSSIPFGFPSSASSASASAAPSAFDPELNPAINHVQLQWRRLNCLSVLSTYSLNTNEGGGTRRNTKWQSEGRDGHNNGHVEQQATTDRGVDNMVSSHMASSSRSSNTTITSASSTISTSSPSPSHIPFGRVWLTLSLLLPLALQRRMLPIESVDVMQRNIPQLLHTYGSNRERPTIRRLFDFTDDAALGMWDESDFIHLCSIALAIPVTDDEPSRPGLGIRCFSPPSTPQQQAIAASAMHFLLNLLIDILTFTQSCNGDGNGTGSGKQLQPNNGNDVAAVLVPVQAGIRSQMAEQMLCTATDAATTTMRGTKDHSNSIQKQHSPVKLERMMQAVRICMEQIQCLFFYLSPFSSSLSPLIGRAYYRMGICCRSYSYGQWSGMPSPLLGLFNLNASRYYTDGRSFVHMRPILIALIEASEEEITALPIEHAVRWIQILREGTADIRTASELLYEHLLLTLMAWQKKQQEKQQQKQEELMEGHDARDEGPDSAPHTSAATLSNSSTIPFDANCAATAAATTAAIHDLADRSVYDWGEIRTPSHLHIWLRCLLDALPRLLISRDILHAFYPIIIPRETYTPVPQVNRRCSHPDGLHVLLRALDQPSMHKHINLHEHIGTGFHNADLSVLTAVFCLPQSSIDPFATHSSRLLSCVGIRHPLTGSLVRSGRFKCYENALLSLTTYSLPHRHHRWRYDWMEVMFGLIRDFELDLSSYLERTSRLLQRLHEEEYFAIDPEKDRERAEDWLYFVRWLDDYSSTHPDASFFLLRHMVTQRLSHAWSSCSLSFPRWWLIEQCQFSMDTDWMLFFLEPCDTYQKDENVEELRQTIRDEMGDIDDASLTSVVAEAAEWWYTNGITQIRSELNLHLIPDLTGLVMEYALYPCMRDPRAPPPNHDHQTDE